MRPNTNHKHKKHDNHNSSSLQTVIGCGVVLSTSALCVIGTSSVVSDINRNFNHNLVLASQNMQNTDAWSDAQTNWMVENHITYNDNGLPVDVTGVVVDDPTTNKDETLLDVKVDTNDSPEAEPSGNQSNTTTGDVVGSTDSSIEKEPETQTSDNIFDWTKDCKEVKMDSHGKYYYSVKAGDTLLEICAMSGYELNELVSHNHIKNASLIHIGEKIYFPATEHVVSGDTNLGLG